MSAPNVTYTSEFYNAETSVEIYTQLFKYPFKSPTLTVHGKTYNPLRKTCSFADPHVTYTYSGHVEQTQPWTELLLKLKESVERATGHSYNYCLLNYYESGKAKIGCHKDNESSLDPATPIPTLSFGACRNMVFSKKGEKSVTMPLETGSLLVMHDQQWYHAIPPQPDVQDGRISLTFRKISTVQSPTKRNLDEWDKEYAIQTNNTSKRFRTNPDLLQQACEEIGDPGFQPSDLFSPVFNSENFLEIIYNPITPLNSPAPQMDNRTLKKIDLGQNVYVTLQLYNKELFLHIRKYYENASGLHPSKK
ncbi:alpha-ketoglutarate-dependent dioxygenase alkb-like protein, partial [Lasius niger]